MTITGPGPTSVPSHVQPVKPARTSIVSQALPHTEDVNAFQQHMSGPPQTKADADRTTHLQERAKNLQAKIKDLQAQRGRKEAELREAIVHGNGKKADEAFASMQELSNRIFGSQQELSRINAEQRDKMDPLHQQAEQARRDTEAVVSRI